MAYTGERNKRTIYVRLNEGEEAIQDSNGYLTGATRIVYGRPIKLRMNVSEAKSRMDRLGSTTYIDPYGLELGYNKVLVTCDMGCPIQEDSVLYIDRMPVLDANGDTDTPWDYILVQIKKSLNNIQYAVKRVDVS